MDNYYWDPYEGQITRDSVSLATLRQEALKQSSGASAGIYNGEGKKIAELPSFLNKILTGLVKLLLPAMKGTILRFGSIGVLAEKAGWGYRPTCSDQSKGQFLKGIASLQVGDTLVNEIWGNQTIRNRVFDWYSTEVVLGQAGASLSTRRLYILNIEPYSKSDKSFNLKPDGKLISGHADVEMESNDFNKLFDIQTEENGVKVFEALNPATMSILIDWVRELGGFELFYRGKFIAILSHNRWPNLRSTQSTAPDGNLKLDINPEDQAAVEKIIHSHLNYCAEFLNSIDFI